MKLSGTHFHYYMICHRKLWLFSNGISMEQNSDLVYEGKIIHETSYRHRSDKFQEIAIDGIKVDYYDAKNKVIHEVKKSNKRVEAHVWQLKYYLWVFLQNGIEGVRGVLEYPKLRKTEEIWLSERDITEITGFCSEIKKITSLESCPPSLPLPKCRNCSYFDFCHSKEKPEVEGIDVD